MITGTNLFCGHFTTVNVAINKKKYDVFFLNNEENVTFGKLLWYNWKKTWGHAVIVK